MFEGRNIKKKVNKTAKRFKKSEYKSLEIIYIEFNVAPFLVSLGLYFLLNC